MKILINAAPLLTSRSGVFRYVYCLAQALLTIDQVNTYGFFYGTSFSRRLREGPDRVTATLRANLLRSLDLSVYLRVINTIKKPLFRAVATLGRYDLYHEPNYVPLSFNGLIVITVHDLSHLSFGHTHPTPRVRWLEENLPRSVRRAERVIAVSQHTKRELMRYVNVAEEKIHVTPLAAAARFRPLPEDLVQRFLKESRLPDRYVLYVGTIEPRKNVEAILNAYALLPDSLRAAYPLILAGRKDWDGDNSYYQRMSQLARQLGIATQTRFVDYISDEDLPKLYNGATAFVYPSSYEGFGLPPLEAMACGVPVITSNSSSLPEVVGDAGYMVEPGGHAQLGERIREVLENPTLREKLSQKGLARAREFSWQRCAQQTLDVYNRAVR